MHSIIIRPACDSDLRSIAELHARNLPHTVSSKLGILFLTRLYRVLISEKPNGNVLVAETDGKIIGVIAFTFDLTCILKRETEKAVYTVETLLRALCLLAIGRITLSELLKRKKFETYLSTSFPHPYPTILTLAVDPDFRRRGVGRICIQYAEKEIRAIGSQHLYVDCESSNTHALVFYRSVGFCEVTRYDTNIVLRKSISNARIDEK